MIRNVVMVQRLRMVILLFGGLSLGPVCVASAEPYCPGFERSYVISDGITLGSLQTRYYTISGRANEDERMYPCDEIWIEAQATDIDVRQNSYFHLQLESNEQLMDDGDVGLTGGGSGNIRIPESAFSHRGTAHPRNIATRFRVLANATGGGVTFAVTVHLRSRPGYNRAPYTSADPFDIQHAPIRLLGTLSNKEGQWHRVSLAAGATIRVNGTIINTSTRLIYYRTYFRNSAGTVLKAYELPVAANSSVSFTGHDYTNTSGSPLILLIQLYNYTGFILKVDFDVTIRVDGLPPPTLTLFLDADKPTNGVFPFLSANPENDIPTYVPGGLQKDDPDPTGPRKGSSVALPQPVQVIAAYVDQSGVIVPPPNPTIAVDFSLIDVSAFDGIAMNAPNPPEAPGPDLVATSPLINVPFGTDQTARLNIAVWDYGGFATVRVTHGIATADEMGVPRDTDNNWLPDAGWTLFANLQPYGEPIITGGLTAGGDDDIVPNGDGTVGDGLINYEEFRGFMVRNEHRRTSPGTKDLFVDSDVSVYDIGAAINLLLTKHWVLFTDLSLERVVNSYYENHGAGGSLQTHAPQQGLVVREVFVDPEGSFRYGVTDCHVGAPCNPNIVGPQNLQVFVGEIRAVTPTHSSYIEPDGADGDAIKKVLGHEIGHGVDMDHYEWGGIGTRLTVMVLGFGGYPDSNWTNIPQSYDNLDNQQLRVR